MMRNDSRLEGVFEVDEDPEDELDRPWNHDRNEVLCIANYPNPVFNEMWFFDRSIHSHEYPCSSQSLLSDKTAGVSSRTFIVKNISNSLTYTIASSCVCTSPLVVMTIAGLHDFVKVSISASLKSFLLIMCIDAPESTTNSLSSSLRVDAGRHLFSEGEECCSLMLLFFFNTFLASSPLLRGHLAHATLSSS